MLQNRMRFQNKFSLQGFQEKDYQTILAVPFSCLGGFGLSRLPTDSYQALSNN